MFSKLKNVFVQIAKCICSDFEFQILQQLRFQKKKQLRANLLIDQWRGKVACDGIAKWISQNCKMYFSKLLNVFVKILDLKNCSIEQMHWLIRGSLKWLKINLSELRNIFVQISKTAAESKCIDWSEGAQSGSRDASSRGYCSRLQKIRMI